MKSATSRIALLLGAWVPLHASEPIFEKPVADVGGGNHQTVVLTPDNKVLTFGQDLHIPTEGGADFIGGKLGRPIDDHVLPGKDPKSLAARANYNPVPARVVGLDGLDIYRVIIGQNDAAAITTSGQLYMWGPNDHGQLGLGDMKQRREAVPVEFPEGALIKDLDIGGAHTLVITTEGRVFASGSNSNGQLGLGDRERRLLPTLVTALADHKVIQVAAGQNTHSLFLTDQGGLFVTGSNVSGQLGLGTDAPRVIDSPVRVPAPVEFKFAAVGVHTTFAIDRDGNLWAAGNGSKAHFGIADADGKPDLGNLRTLTRLPNAPPNLVAVGGGSRHVAVLDAEGKIFTWGIHATLSAQLGIGEPKVSADQTGLDGIIYTDPQHVPLPDGRKAIKIHVIANNVFAVAEDGKIYGWGQTAHGRLGYGVQAVHSIVNSKGRTLYNAHSPIEIPVTEDESKIKITP